MSEEKERILKILNCEINSTEVEEDNIIDYSSEYRKQTGKDLFTDEYVTQ